jgi:hypothetical protein
LKDNGVKLHRRMEGKTGKRRLIREMSGKKEKENQDNM